MTSPIADRRLYLYAIVDGNAPPEAPLAGLADAPVSTLPYRDIAAAVSHVDVDQLQPEAEQLLRHEAVIETLMAQRSTLPVRFGAVLGDAERVRATLAERYVAFKADLERLAGQVEVGLRVVWDANAVRREHRLAMSPDTVGAYPCGRPVEEMSHCVRHDNEKRPGTRYLLARLQEEAAERFVKEQAELLEAWCRQRLGPLANDMTTRVLATEGLPVSAALLTPRDQVPALLAATVQMGRERPDLDFVCTGPWPPYHFVTSQR